MTRQRALAGPLRIFYSVVGPILRIGMYAAYWLMKWAYGNDTRGLR